jgi:hypothetical protein
VRNEISAAAEKGIDVVTVDQVQQIATEAGLPAAQAEAVAADYGDAELAALERSLLAVAFAGVLAFWFTRRLPGRAGLRQPAGDAAQRAD